MLRYFTVNTIAELLCFIAAVTFLPRQNVKSKNIIVIFLFVTVFTEMCGIHIKKVNHAPNAWVYNLLLIAQAAFFLTVFWQLLSGSKKRNLLIISGAVIVALTYSYEAIKNTFFEQTPIDRFLYYNTTYTTLSVIIIVYCLCFLYLLMDAEEYVTLGHMPAFWWVAGTLFFFFGSTAVNLFYFIIANMEVRHQQKLTTYIYYVLNVVLYSSWAYSFICKRWLHPQLSK
jgi:hypothetical protein